MTKTIQFIMTILVFSLFITACEKDPVEPIDPEPTICDIHVTDDITESTTWEASCTYYIDRSINIKNDAILTIEPGTVIKFAPGKQLDVADYSNESGNIVALGTKDKPILFTSQAQLPAKGDWNGIWLYEGSSASKLKYCKIEYSGGGNNSTDNAAIATNSEARVSIDYCTFENNENYGVIDRNHNQGVFTSFTNNTFINNAINDMRVNAFNVGSIGEGNSFSKDIDVTGNSVDTPGDVLWRNHNANYNILNIITVGCPTGTKLIIEAGASIRFTQGKGIEVAYASTRYGLIEAIGTATEPITFTSSNSNPSKGDWDRIVFYDGSSDGSIFDYCNFSYGGGYSGAPAMIVFKYQQGSTTTIKNCSFSHSEGYGIMLDQPNNDTNYPTLSNNTFSNNTSGDINW